QEDIREKVLCSAMEPHPHLLSAWRAGGFRRGACWSVRELRFQHRHQLRLETTRPETEGGLCHHSPGVDFAALENEYLASPYAGGSAGESAQSRHRFSLCHG